jgi:anti-sigma B factor antagonist
MEPMTTRRSDLDGVPLIVTEGDIDHSTCAGVERLLDEAISQGNDLLFVDLTEVSYIDSGGLSVLFAAGRRVRDVGWIGLIAPNSSVLRLLELVGALADPAFRVFDDRSQAEDALAKSVSS